MKKDVKKPTKEELEDGGRAAFLFVIGFIVVVISAICLLVSLLA